MTKTYAAKRLLEHGPLMFQEVHAITGWPKNVVKNALNNLSRRGIARNNGQHKERTLWELRRGRA